MGSGLGGIDDSHMRRRHSAQQRLEQRIMRAAEHKSVGVVETVTKGLAQINAGYLFRDRVLHPSFFDERHQQRASLLPRIKAAGLKSFLVGVAADRGLGPDDHDSFIFADRSGGLGAGLYYANDWNAGCGDDAVESKRGRRVAGDDQQLGSVGFKIVSCFDGITRYRFHRLGAVGKARGIAKVEIISVWNEFK